MDLAAELGGLRASRTHRGPTCTVSVVLAELEPEDRAALERVLADRAISATRVSTILNRHGHIVSAPAINRHRRGRINGGCACHEDAL